VEMSADTMVQRVKGVPFTRLGDELLAVDSEGGYVYALNETGGMVWDWLESPMAVDELCRRLRQTFDVDEPTCLAAVTQVLRGLEDAGLVEIV